MDSALIHNLKYHLNLIAGKNSFSDALEYALIPPGKLFRPSLALCVARDLLPDVVPDEKSLKQILSNPLSNLSLIASFLEFHHSYTLIHDDLPCMDDDDYRRGKLSVHKKFNESLAVLAGDALLLGSLELLGKIKTLKASDLSLICKLLGSKGLIYGQVLDMDAKKKQNIEHTIHIHYLKTGKLLQAALLIPLIAHNRLDMKNFIKLYKIGKHLGILFQLLDDLTEIAESIISQHEQDINPWLSDAQKSFSYLTQILKSLRSNLAALPHTKIFCTQYLDKIKKKLDENALIFETNTKIFKIEKDLGLKPIMALLNSF